MVVAELADRDPQVRRSDLANPVFDQALANDQVQYQVVVPFPREMVALVGQQVRVADIAKGQGAPVEQVVPVEQVDPVDPVVPGGLAVPAVPVLPGVEAVAQGRLVVPLVKAVEEERANGSRSRERLVGKR